VDTRSILISRAFWTLFTLEAIACAAYMYWATHDTRGWGPEGPVGAWLVYLVPPMILGIPLAIVLIGRSAQATLAGLVSAGEDIAFKLCISLLYRPTLI
jgi:hypothetical protein